MADVHSKKIRSYNMSRIKGRNTKPEILIRKFLFSKGLRFRLHAKNLPGKPDIVLPKYKTVIFVHGCFWHGHSNCKYFVMPKTRRSFWEKKIFGNKEKDLRSLKILRKLGWKSITVWECQLKSKEIDKTLTGLIDKICL